MQRATPVCKASSARVSASSRVLRLNVSAVTEGAVPARSYKVTLRKPMGIIFAETQGRMGVYVEELVPGGNAEKCGIIRVNDVLTGCSAYAFKDDLSMEEGYGKTYSNWEKIYFNCRSQSFDTIMKAIGSNNERWGIFDCTLEFERFAEETVAAAAEAVASQESGEE